MLARGLAPNSMSGARSFIPCLAGSRVASFIHSAARALHSNWVDIGTPCLRVDLILANLRQVPFSDYCPQGHCPNGQVGLTERSGAARADAGEDSLECMGFYQTKGGGNPALQP